MTRRTPPRSHLRLADLKQRRPVPFRLLNVKVPSHIADAIDRLAQRLHASKTETVTALLTAALTASGRTRR
jgi:hypothetical protein